MKKEKEIFYRPLSEVFKGRRLSFDIDGVLSLTVYPVVGKVNEDFGTTYDIADFSGWATVRRWAEKNWDRRKPFVDSVAKTPEEYDAWVWTDPEVLLRGLLGPGSDYVTRCAAEAASYYRVVTSRVPELRESTYRWSEANLPWIDRDRISMNEDPSVSGEVFKHKEIARHGIDLHFEDSLRHAKLIVENTPATVILLSNWDVARNEPYSHPRIVKVTRLNHRLTTMRDVHKKLIFEPNFIPSHNVDRP